MKKLLFVSAILLSGCTGVNKGSVEDVDSISCDNDTLVEDTISFRPSLNDIRFANFTEKDWLDNEYLRKLRVYIDNYCKGDKTNKELDPYKKYMKSKFVVMWVEPAIMGGMYIQFTFLDLPSQCFESWVYSYVDVDKETVTGYEVRSVHVGEKIPDMTIEEILEAVKNHPELKLY